MAQINEGGMPISFITQKHGKTITEKYEVKTFTQPNIEAIEQEDLQEAEKGRPYRVAINVPVNLNLQNSGTWTLLDNGDKIWRLGIKIPAAKALNIYFSTQIDLPVGGKLHAYNQKHSQYVGAYTHLTDQFKAIEMIEGELLTLEYFMPAGSQTLPDFNIESVGYFYRGVGERIEFFTNGRPVDSDRADACEVDVACSEILGWESERDAVVRYTFVTGNSTFLCSGSIINNTAVDCTPYLLSANHCGEPTSSSQIADHTWYFNYQRPTCSIGNTNPYNGAQSQTMQGGILKASSELGTHTTSSSSQLSGSDFVLIELSNTIPTSYNAYYAGWNRTSSGATSGVSIHHPAGDEKKISTFSSTTATATYNSGWAGAHWEVYWDATANGHGVTEGGSSGSPLFNSSKEIIGHLSGGAASCANTSESDLYGKFNKAWSLDGNTINSQLKSWLDPNNTGLTSLAGTYAPCGSTSTTYCTATSATCDEFIRSVTLGGIANTTNCNYYTHYWQNQPIDMAIGLSYMLQVNTAVVGDSIIYFYDGDQLAAWIDWNSDGDFDDAGELALSHTFTTSSSLPRQSIISVPFNATPGETRMRIRITYDTSIDGPISPCGNSEFGEVEDYQINITGTPLSTLSEKESSPLLIYPNPSSGIFNLKINAEGNNIHQISIYNTQGAIIKSINTNNNSTQIDLTELSKGVYFVHLISANEKYIRKIILN
ncbi:GEVED domain-containing protein [Putridiphycobacter roseus]|uniref:GEVED domain-containing protein n=1 Tax=Putridiphycobacter roseus TaxID=2219161 RepID=UPI001314A6D4|nr:GEVED domain-containing protein [Putridiphycobacter roseus]